MTLFIIKKFYSYAGTKQVSNGLKSSARFVVEMLAAEGHRASLVEAIDANCIDRIVTEHRPKRVIIEALWVTPAKFSELQSLHPSVEWTVRIHSEIPFLANEGVAVEWIIAYLAQGVSVGFNSRQTFEDFESLNLCGDVEYLPNFYPLRKPRARAEARHALHVGCFGAVRPLKNQLIQAFGAVRFAATQGRPLVLHMNGSRIEQAGENNLRQIQALMDATGNELVMHPWLDHGEFLELIATMDICLQVSLSESFNIVSADAVSMGVPLIGSAAIEWLPKRSKAAVNSVESICAAMGRADVTNVHMNHAALEDFLVDSMETWNRWAQ